MVNLYREKKAKLDERKEDEDALMLSLKTADDKQRRRERDQQISQSRDDEQKALHSTDGQKEDNVLLCPVKQPNEQEVEDEELQLAIALSLGENEQIKMII